MFSPGLQLPLHFVLAAVETQATGFVHCQPLLILKKNVFKTPTIISPNYLKEFLYLKVS